MPKEHSVKHFRKGTKSCVECRQRKQRCDGSQPCQNCRLHDRSCVLQTALEKQDEHFKTTSRERIGQLEKEVGSLWSVVRDLRARAGLSNEDTPHESKTSWSAMTNDSDSEESEDGPVNPPMHLQQLLETGVFHSPETSTSTPALQWGGASSAAIAAARTKLQDLVPSQEVMQACLGYVSSWLQIYNDFFPKPSIFVSSQEMLSNRELVMAETASPASIASTLLTLAITIDQVPSGYLQEVPDVPKFIRDVEDAVEQNIIHNNYTASTLEGIETSLLYFRFLLSRGKSRKLWLMLRRIIAIAEMIGIPKAVRTYASHQASGPSAARLQAATGIWKSICLADSMSGLLFNLPFGTLNYSLPVPQSVTVDGRVQPSLYLQWLRPLAVKILEIDDIPLTDDHANDALMYGKVMAADRELNTLGQLVPSDWWATDSASRTIGDHVIYFWHQYSTIRIHHRLALTRDQSDLHNYSHTVCLRASRRLAESYASMRNVLPPGFFAARTLDLEVLTAAVFLLHSWFSSNTSSANALESSSQPSDLASVRGLCDVMETNTDQVGGEMARHGAKAIRSLIQMLGEPDNSGAREVKLKIPLLGHVVVHRRPRAPAPSVSSMSQPAYIQQPTTQAIPNRTYDSNHQNAMYGTANPTLPDSLDWSMDFMADFPFMADDNYGSNDSWLFYSDLSVPQEVTTLGS